MPRLIDAEGTMRDLVMWEPYQLHLFPPSPGSWLEDTHPVWLFVELALLWRENFPLEMWTLPASSQQVFAGASIPPWPLAALLCYGWWYAPRPYLPELATWSRRDVGARVLMAGVQVEPAALVFFLTHNRSLVVEVLPRVIVSLRSITGGLSRRLSTEPNSFLHGKPPLALPDLPAWCHSWISEILEPSRCEGDYDLAFEHRHFPPALHRHNVVRRSWDYALKELGEMAIPSQTRTRARPRRLAAGAGGSG